LIFPANTGAQYLLTRKDNTIIRTVKKSKRATLTLCQVRLRNFRAINQFFSFCFAFSMESFFAWRASLRASLLFFLSSLNLLNLSFKLPTFVIAFETFTTAELTLFSVFCRNPRLVLIRQVTPYIKS